MKKLALISLIVGLQGCSAKPPVPAAPPPEQFVEHTIALRGETLGAIASWYTGSAGNWPRIAAANPGLDPKRLRMGQVVNVPEGMVTRREPLTEEFLARVSKVEFSLPAAPAESVEVARLDGGAPSISDAPTGGAEKPQQAPSGAAEGALEPPQMAADAGAPDLNTQLYQAVLLEDSAMVKSLLAKGADVNHQENARALLAWAAQTPDSTVLKPLIEGGADVNAVDGIGHTALIRAAAIGNLSNLKTLIEAKADLNVRDRDGNTALISAVRDNYVEVLGALLGAGADPNITDNDGNSAALLAAQATDLTALKALGAAKADFNISNAAFTPLVFAITQGRTELVQAVLDGGADPNRKTAADQYPLHMAIGSPDIVKALLAAKADPNIIDDFGGSPLARAVRDGDLASAEALVTAGADVNAKTMNGSSLLAAAKFGPNPEIATFLAAHGAAE